MHSIINIINFIRAVEPRDPELDLVEPIVNQIELVRRHGLAATWLLQYDALIEERFVAPLKELDDFQEIGAWFEVVQPLVEKVGLKWRGRPGYAWDWHSDVGFSVGYTPKEREMLADEFMAEFKRVFGQYPASVGSWFMDAHLLGYLADKYGVRASCNCRDQWGTDGYTLWGGYWNQAYYPSRINAYIPAQNESNQIPIPVFRMLGSDPIYQYDVGVGPNGQGVVTLEPSYSETAEGGGGVPAWVDWFFGANFGTPCLTFNYAQVGQENSFGWAHMRDGLTYQINLIAGKVARGEVQVETLCTSAEWFRANYPVTPASAVTALTDWKNQGRKSIWYNSRYYRANLFWEDNEFRIRDIHLFDESYQERYLTKVCTTHNAIYDTPPVFDGFRWSDAQELAKFRMVQILPDDFRCTLHSGEPEVEEHGEALLVKWRTRRGTKVKVSCKPSSLRITLPKSTKVKWAIELSWPESIQPPIVSVERDRMRYSYNNHAYEVRSLAGVFDYNKDKRTILVTPTDEAIELELCKLVAGISL